VTHIILLLFIKYVLRYLSFLVNKIKLIINQYMRHSTNERDVRDGKRK